MLLSPQTTRSAAGSRVVSLISSASLPSGPFSRPGSTTQRVTFPPGATENSEPARGGRGPGPDYARRRGRNRAGAPTPAQGAPSAFTTSRSGGPRFGVSQYSAIKRYPAPNHQPRTADSRQVGAARISSSPGTRPNQARNSRFSEPKASTGKAPASKAA